MTDRFRIIRLALLLLAIPITLISVNCSSGQAEPSGRLHILLDSTWRFHREPTPTTVPSLSDTLGSTPVVPQAAFAYDDRLWRIVHLPHDYIVEGTFDPNADGGHGFLPFTTAWYRKSFASPASYRGKSIWIDFEGVYRDAQVWINGHYLGTHLSGYAGFRFDVAPYLNYGARNVLAVHVDPTRDEGWFYEGGGIYRHVWLTVADPVHIAPDGEFVTSSIKLGARNWARVVVRSDVTNTSSRPQACRIVWAVTAPDGSSAGRLAANGVIPAGATNTFVSNFIERNAELWSLSTPQLYTLRTTVVRNGLVVDGDRTAFGLRTIRFDPNFGFFLNGKHVELKGTCNHQDFAGVGSAIPDNLFYWRVKRLKEMGSNAYRTSHNEVAPALLDACDRLGMLVMDETRHFGDTQDPKSGWGTRTDDLSDLRQMVRRDRNHPSVIMWSIANEEPLQGSSEGRRIGIAMKRVVEECDGTRPVTAAMNGGWGPGGLSDVLDVQGFNYGIPMYDQYHSQFPDIPLYGSETSSDVGTRGEYADNAEMGYVRAYDTEHPDVGWGASAEAAWSNIADRPFMAGAFVWTGFDYRGEPTPYSWPDINSNFGIMDMCGFPKDNYYYYQAWWGDKPLVHIVPHWNWAGKEGRQIPVWVYSNTQQVELFLNGQSLGIKPMPKFGHVTWWVAYTPGSLVARGYSAGKMIAQDREVTTGAPVAIKLTVTSGRPLLANGEDAAVVAVDIVDKHGRIVPTASNLVAFRVSGGGHIDGVGNGDPSCHQPDKGDRRSAFNGRCIVVVQSNEGTPAPIQVTAESPGLPTAHATVAEN